MNPIEKIRKENGLTRDEMSLVLGVPYSTLAVIENGNYKNPKKVVEKMAIIFEEDEEKLLEQYNHCRQEKREKLMKKIK